MRHLRRVHKREQHQNEIERVQTIVSAVFRVNLESAMRVPKTQSTFHLRAQRNAFHRDARQRSISFARWNPRHVADPVDYGTRKNFPVYGSFTMDPDTKSVTS